MWNRGRYENDPERRRVLQPRNHFERIWQTTVPMALVATWALPYPAAGFEPGPDVGEPIPAFSVADQHGVDRVFEDLKGPEGLLLLFHRSADW